MNFTFKKSERQTGLLAVVARRYTDVKLDGRKVGTISHNDGSWRVWFSIKKEPTKEDPAPFRNVVLKQRFDSDASARQFVTAHSLMIQHAYNLHQFEA